MTNGITISGATTRIHGVGRLAANVTTSGTNDTPVIDANGGTLEITGLLSDPGNGLTVGATQAGDLLLLDSGGHVNQVFFNSSTVELGGNLTVGSQMTINGTLQLDSGATLTDASGVTLNGGVITGAGTVTANVTATGAAIIRANGGTLGIVGDIIDSVDSLTLALTLDGDRLIHTAPNGPSHSSAHVANIDNVVGTLELSPNSDLTVATPMAIGNSTLQLDVASIGGATVSASLADDAGVTINAGSITGAGTITAAVTATGAATITASGGIIQLNRPVIDSGNALSLDMAGDGDGFSVNGVVAAHSLSFNGHAGLVSLFPGADLTVAMPIDVGIGRVLLGEDSQLHNSAVSISSGTIQGTGLVDAAVTATGAALISATEGKLEFTGPIVDSGDALKLQIYNALGELKLDAPTAAHTVEFFPFFSSGPGGIVTLTSQASLTVATQMAIEDGTIALAGPNAVLIDANGATLNGGSIQGFGKVNAGLTGTGTIMASGGTLELQTAIGNSSGPVFQVANAASNILQLEGTVGTGNSFAFLGPNGDLGLGTDAGFNNVISGLNVGAAGAKTNFVDIEGHTVTIQTVTGGGTTSGSIALSDGAVLQLTGLNATAWFANAVSDGGTEIFVSDVCFCRGTLILTDEGEVAVEALAVGDRVRTLSGECKPIVWIGFGRDLVTRANRLARPIVVRRGALADDVPRRDLYLTHGHALHLEGVLIPVEHLVNHRSILWDDTARVVEYYHIELADHDVVLAEGAPAESYYDASNRAQFLNTREGSEAGAKKPTYAPVLNGGDVVENAWARLCERAGGQIECDTTDDPDLHLVVDGERLDPVSREGCVYTFALARPPAGTLLVRSRSAVPSLIGLNRHEHRQLGVAVRQIIVHRPGVMTSFDPDGPMFAEGGCHPAESGYSWTDGELHLPTPLFAHLKGALTLIIHTQKHAMRYPVAAALAKAA